jgi:peptidoglycan hydrolase CwlO-like protein
VLAGVALGGADLPVAGAVPGEAPTGKPTRLRARAARVQAAIDRMSARVESLVEQARTRRHVLDARRRLRAARRLLGRRLWTVCIGGPPSTLGQLLGADSVRQALVTTQYQEQVVGADRAAVDRVERLRREVEALAAELAAQNERQERLQARLAAQRRQIEARLAAQRRCLERLTRQVRRAVAEERRRQGRLRRQALRRRLAAERAAASWSRPPIPGPGSASPPSAAAATSAPSDRPADRFERSERMLLVRLRGSRSPGSNTPLFVYEHVAGRLRSAPPARRAVRAQ